MDPEKQSQLWQLQRYRDLLVQLFAESLGEGTLFGDPHVQEFRDELSQKFREAYPDWAMWFKPPQV